jgi:hypothetical protein
VSAIDTILDKDEYTLDELLDEEEILQEVKSQNKRLLDLYDNIVVIVNLLFIDFSFFFFFFFPLCSLPRNSA